MEPGIIFQQLFNTLSLISIFILIALGLAIIFGLMCLFQRWQEVKEWLKDNGYLEIDLPDIRDCGCED